MPCYHPLTAYRTSGGDVVFVERGDIVSQLDLPCGRCIGCRLERSRQWATRIMFESQLHARSAFVTLTYDDDHVPSPPSLDYSHVQKFLKRLRFRTGLPIRFFAVGEYGELNARPHYHLILFGVDFKEDCYLYKNSGENPIYRSPFLESIWTDGMAPFGDVTFESAAYCARYVCKKITGDLAQIHYALTDPDTGEVSMLTPEFAHMSLKPGIGAQWFEKYSDDVYSGHDFVVVNGKKCKPPRYFDKLFRRMDVDAFLQLKVDREFNAYPRRADGVPSRLAVREKVHKAAVSNLRRKL